MKKEIKIGASVLLVIIVGTLVVFKNRSTADADPTSGFQQWTPNVTEVHDQIAHLNSGGSREEPASLASCQLFARLITRRFRGHTPPIAVLVKYHPSKWFALECPARMEPWNLDNLALDIWRESRRDLAISCPVMIYRTYIGAKPVLVGQLLPDKANGDRATIAYDKAGEIGGAIHSTPAGPYSNP